MEKCKAFSLIELIIVIGIIAVFSGVTLAYYNNYTQDKNLEKETRHLVDILELARKKANSADSSMCNPSTSLVISYSVSIIDKFHYRILAECESGSNKIIEYTTENNINILTTPTVVFYPLTLGVNPTCIVLQNLNLISHKCRYVSIESSGIISDGKCSDCATCGCP